MPRWHYRRWRSHPAADVERIEKKPEGSRKMRHEVQKRKNKQNCIDGSEWQNIRIDDLEFDFFTCKLKLHPHQ